MGNERINVCYGIADVKGNYSKFTGTSICSVFENTDEPLTIHLIHDSTLTDYNRKNFQMLAQEYDQQIEFYDVSARWRYMWDRIRTKLPYLVKSRCTIGMFYRLVIGDILAGENRVIYLDSDTIVNRDIRDLWKCEIPASGLAASSDLYVQEVGDKMIREGVVSRNDYFNSGVLLLDLRRVRNVRNLIDKVLNFILRYEPDYPDQDALNYLFPHSNTLPNEYNTFVNMAIDENWPIDRNIYHYANNSLGLKMDNKFNKLYFGYFKKTPWCDEVFLGNFVRQTELIKSELLELSNQCAGKRRIVIGPLEGKEAIADFLEINSNDVYITMEEIDVQQSFDFNRKKDIILVFLHDTNYILIRRMLVSFGLAENADFINMSAKVGLENSRMSDYGIILNC